MKHMNIYFEQQTDGTWLAVWEDYYSDCGYGDSQYEALENLVQRIEELFEDEEE